MLSLNFKLLFLDDAKFKLLNLKFSEMSYWKVE